ncbi:hypothetical protein [Sorangium sp. So ce1000]|uniref:hypothetical protein n=1 Tax=Sorangium sp. So ce1000 TaxID=3133325 RepID=UPI003F6432F3
MRLNPPVNKLRSAHLGPVLALLVAPLALGCVSEVGHEDEGALDEPVGEAQAAVGWWSYGWGCSGSCELNLGSDTDRTCFLSGVWGKLGASSQASVRVTRSGGQWTLYVDSASGQNLGANAVCVNTVENRTGQYTWTWGPGDGLPTSMGFGTSSRRCFLTQVTSNGAFKYNNWITDYARVLKDVSGEWFLEGASTTGVDTPVTATVKAICVDVPQNYGAWQWIAGNNHRIDPLANDSIGGVVCGMTGLGGPFTSNSWTDGVWLEYNSTTLDWEQHTVNNKTAWSQCVR